MKGVKLTMGGGLLAAMVLVLSPAQAQADVDFVKDIQPILEGHCVKCHNADKQKSDLRMDTREFLLTGGTEGPTAIEGDSANSLMIALVEGTNPDYDQMPPKGGPLSPEQIAALKAWIDAGMAWPDGLVLVAAEEAAAPAATGDNPTQASVAGLPEDWKVEATNQDGPLATWEISPDITGPDGKKAIVLTSTNHMSPSTLNLLWTPKPNFKNGAIEVKLKTLAGEVDQGGGLIWRAKDKDNYYVARYNPKEKNFRFYKVVAGEREQIASADIALPPFEWVTVRIEQTDAKFTGYLNGDKVLEAEDTTFTEGGGVGYWTKADASTAFAGTKLEAQ